MHAYRVIHWVFGRIFPLSKNEEKGEENSNYRFENQMKTNPKFLTLLFDSQTFEYRPVLAKTDIHNKASK